MVFHTTIAIAEEGAAVGFSGVVKKVKVDDQKVAIMDPETKKRFTIIVNEKTRLDGFSKIDELKKKDAVTGHYIVTKDGKYIATELSRK